jgi:ATP-dependent Zn protease
MYNLYEKKAIILIEDIDRIWNTLIINTEDKFDSDSIDKKIGLDSFLSFIDMSISNGIIIIVSCNELIMDNAFLRDGRFDYKLYLEYCDNKQLSQIIEYFFGKSLLKNDQLIKYVESFPDKQLSVATIYSQILNIYLTSNN